MLSLLTHSATHPNFVSMSNMDRLFAPGIESKPYLLRLPIELLQLVAEQCDPTTDIISLRLACKALAAAALSPFAEELIANLTNIILDPIRLLRAINIIATPHPSSNIRTLTLSLSAHDKNYDHPLAPNAGETRRDTEDAVVQMEAIQQYSLHECRRRVTFSGLSLPPQQYERAANSKLSLGRGKRSWCSIARSMPREYSMVETGSGELSPCPEADTGKKYEARALQYPSFLA